MRIFYDTEFRDTGSIIDFISIGLVRDDGDEYYAVASDFDIDAVRKHDWLLKNVWPGLPVRGLEWESYSISAGIRRRVKYAGHLDNNDTRVKPKWVIRNEVREFILGTPDPSLWAWYAAYDHVALAQLWGAMVHLPKGIPMWTNDLKQEAERLGNPELPIQDPETVHNALEDARHNLARARVLDEIAGRQ